MVVLPHKSVLLKLSVHCVLTRTVPIFNDELDPSTTVVVSETATSQASTACGFFISDSFIAAEGGRFPAVDSQLWADVVDDGHHLHGNDLLGNPQPSVAVKVRVLVHIRQRGCW